MKSGCAASIGRRARAAARSAIHQCRPHTTSRSTSPSTRFGVGKGLAPVERCGQCHHPDLIQRRVHHLPERYHHAFEPGSDSLGHALDRTFKQLERDLQLGQIHQDAPAAKTIAVKQSVHGFPTKPIESVRRYSVAHLPPLIPAARRFRVHGPYATCRDVRARTARDLQTESPSNPTHGFAHYHKQASPLTEGGNREFFVSIRSSNLLVLNILPPQYPGKCRAYTFVTNYLICTPSRPRYTSMIAFVSGQIARKGETQSQGPNLSLPSGIWAARQPVAEGGGDIRHPGGHA